MFYGPPQQVLFVTGGKFTKEEQFAWDIMRSALFDNDILRFTTIVRTRFTGFRDAEKRQRDIQLLKNENDELRKILESCRSVIHMNNLTADEDPSQQSRKDGGTVLRTYLYTCKDRYLPPNLSQLNEKVGRLPADLHRLAQHPTLLGWPLHLRERSFATATGRPQPASCGDQR